MEYVARGPCEVREKIRNDTFRYLISFLVLLPHNDQSLGP